MFTKVKTYIQATYEELVHKVTWPTWAEVQNSAVVVMIATFIIAVLVFLMDISLKSIMQFIYGFFN